MRSWDDEEELTTVAPYRYEGRPQLEEDEDGHLHLARISRREFTPPPGLSWRQRRRYQKDSARQARAEQREHNRSTVMRARAQVGDGLGVPLLIAAIVLAAVVFWPRDEPAERRTAAEPTAAATAGPTASAPAVDNEDGHDHEGPAVDADELGLTGPAGETVYRFLVAFDDYNPGYPDPIDTWAAGWAPYATGDLVDQAPQLATGLWAEATAARQLVTGHEITDCTHDGGSRYTCDVVRNLFPLGGDAASGYQQQRVTYQLDVDPDGQRVRTLAVLATDAPAAAG